MYQTRTTVKFHFVADDGSEVVTTNVGEAMDSADKGMNKTMSCALKYALMQMFLIPTKETEDTDRETPPDTVPTRPKQAPAAPAVLNTEQTKKLADVLEQVKNLKTADEVKQLFNSQEEWLQNVNALRKAVTDRFNELSSAAA